MDRDTVADRLPTDRIPRLGGSEDTSQPITGQPGREDDAADATDEEVALSGQGPSGRTKLRKLLLGVSLAGLVLAVLAILLRRVLGGSDSDDDADGSPESETPPQDDEADEPEPEPPADAEVESVSDLLTADAEGAAAMVGLGFNLLVRALVDDDGVDA